jgi:putative two-component system response regulator
MIPDQDSHRILIVDDEENVRELVQRIMMGSGFHCDEAAGGREALARLEQDDYSLMISDINMPEMNGIELLSFAKKKYRDLAVIMLTAVDDRNIAIKTLELGAYGYVIKPFERNEVIINAVNALRRRQLEMDNRRYSEELEELVEERTIKLRRAEKEVRRSREETILSLSRAAEFRDNETAQHTVRMSHYCKLLAARAGLPEEECERIRVASPLHDVGKLGVPDAILLKPGRLTPDEFEQIKKHTEIGRRIFSDMESGLLQLGAEIAFTHHEKYDGSGYPRGLAGENIPLVGRIAAICDVFDALTSDRVYKKAMEVEQAVEIMRKESGSHFDPVLLELFLDSMDEVLGIKAAFADHEK